jgi:FKBP-type peptidyl-prolyl cis-trans isomerase SlyD
MQVEKDKVVSIDYTLTDSQGQVIDSSNGRPPLEYLHGKNNIIPGLERALEGKNEGDAVKVSIAPGEGYGERDANLVQSVPKEMFKGVDNIEVGMQFQAKGPNGAPRIVTITKVEGENVMVDGNHPLAGETLNFDVKVMGVREASAEELQHGHVHGPGGHHH